MTDSQAEQPKPFPPSRTEHKYWEGRLCVQREWNDKWHDAVINLFGGISDAVLPWKQWKQVISWVMCSTDFAKWSNLIQIKIIKYFILKRKSSCSAEWLLLFSIFYSVWNKEVLTSQLQSAYLSSSSRNYCCSCVLSSHKNVAEEFVIPENIMEWVRVDCVLPYQSHFKPARKEWKRTFPDSIIPATFWIRSACWDLFYMEKTQGGSQGKEISGTAKRNCISWVSAHELHRLSVVPCSVLVSLDNVRIIPFISLY